MSAYVGSSALLKRYLDESDSQQADRLLAEAGGIFISRLSVVEVRRALGASASFVTFDGRQAAVARDLGFSVKGA